MIKNDWKSGIFKGILIIWVISNVNMVISTHGQLTNRAIKAVILTPCVIMWVHCGFHRPEGQLLKCFWLLKRSFLSFVEEKIQYAILFCALTSRLMDAWWSNSRGRAPKKVNLQSDAKKIKLSASNIHHSLSLLVYICFVYLFFLKYC